MSDLFPCTNICRDAVFTMITSIPERKEKMTTLKMMWDSGDLSFAPDPNSYDYIHRSKDNINLSLSVINQMTVSIYFELFVSTLPNTNNNSTIVSFVSISEIIIEPSIM
jgi:hypothetical protein